MLRKSLSYLPYRAVSKKTMKILDSMPKTLREDSRTQRLRKMAPGPTELIIIGILAIFLFGAKRIPDLARNLGRAKGEFHAGISDVTSPSSAEIDMDRGGVSDDVVNENE